MIDWTQVEPERHEGSATPSARQYMVRRIPSGWQPTVYARMEKPMSNHPKDPTPYVPEALVEGWRPLLVGPFETVDEAMAACEENERRMEASPL